MTETQEEMERIMSELLKFAATVGTSEFRVELEKLINRHNI
jgi:hypothetical protein